ncbi:MAG: hypothetical protein ACREX7_08435, partial [Casimicrobiaceae bacterium]
SPHRERRRRPLDTIRLARSARARELSLEPLANTSSQFADELRNDIARWAAVVNAAGIRVE